MIEILTIVGWIVLFGVPITIGLTGLYIVRLNKMARVRDYPNRQIKSNEEKKYTEEDMKQFGIWLGENYKRNRNKLIDELFDEFIKQ